MTTEDNILETTDSGQGGAFVFDKLLIIRLVAASVLFAVALIAELSELVRLGLLILSAAAAGYDIVMAAVNDVAAKEYFGAPLIATFVTVLSFVIGFGAEGAAFVVLYQIGMVLISYAKARTVRSAIELVDAEKDDVTAHMALLFSHAEAGRTDFEERMRTYMSVFTRVLLALAVVYAVVLPLISDFSYTVSIHRALVITAIATPLSALCSLRLTDIVGVGFAASNGIVYNSTAAFDKTAAIKSVIFDKAGVLSDGNPRLASVRSEKLPSEVFVRIAAHVAHRAEDADARALARSYDGDIDEALINNFMEIPGLGCSIETDGSRITLGTAQYLSGLGAEIPPQDLEATMFLAIGSSYAGCLTLTEGINAQAGEIATEYLQSGLESCVLLTENGYEETQTLADSLGMTEYYAMCTPEKKLEAVQQVAEDTHGAESIYIYSHEPERHSAASIDACMGINCRRADVFIEEGGLYSLPIAMFASDRAGSIRRENVLIALVVKLLIIALTLTGFCNLWFAVFLDTAAALALILNTIRVTTPSLLTQLKKDKE